MFPAAPEVKDDADQVKGIPLPLNPDQLPRPIQPHNPKDQVPPEAVHHRQSESPHPPLSRQPLGEPHGLKGPNPADSIPPPLPTVASSMKGV